MLKRCFILTLLALLLAGPAPAVGTRAPEMLEDLYFGEALYSAFQGEWFDAIARLDIELMQHENLDDRVLDPFIAHYDQAVFAVGDFELAYRMHRRAGRAISNVIEGNVDVQTRNEAIFRLAKIYFHKDQPRNALLTLDRINGEVASDIRDDLGFFRAQVLMANGRLSDAIVILEELRDKQGLLGFAGYNLGIARLQSGNEVAGRLELDRAGQISSNDEMTLSVRDKANLLLGEKLLEDEAFEQAGVVLDRVRLQGPFSARALLSAGWAAASLEDYKRALVPWTLLSERNVTDAAVQEALLAVPYSFGKLDVYSKAAILYGQALEAFGDEIDKLTDSIASVREGRFLKALVREELKQDANWVVRLRELPATPETYYLLDLMASHEFQESLKNYLDLDTLHKKLTAWQRDLVAYEDIIATRRAYYQPLLPSIDAEFRKLDSRMRLRLEQRDHIDQRLKAMLVAPRPDFLATADERLNLAAITRLEQSLGPNPAAEVRARLERLRGLVFWPIYTHYDQRLMTTYKNLLALDADIDDMQKQYDSFVRVRQAATLSYSGYGQTLGALRIRITRVLESISTVMARQGHLLENMAESELVTRREKLEEMQVKARFAMADSFDRATRKRAAGKEAP